MKPEDTAKLGLAKANIEAVERNASLAINHLHLRMRRLDVILNSLETMQDNLNVARRIIASFKKS